MKTLKKISKNAGVRIITIHAVCWILYICYELISLYNVLGKLESAYIYAIYYCLNISLFYTTVWVLHFTFDHLKKRLLQGILRYAVIICIYFTIKFTVDYFLESPHVSIIEHLKYFRVFFFHSLFRGFYFVLLATFYWAAGYLSNYKRQIAVSEQKHLLILKNKAELEARLTKSQNAYLRQQINPHMLFNTLNFIYNSVHKNSPEAAHSIALLSEIIRFNLEPTDSDGKILLSKELEQLQFLLEINRYRFDYKLYIEITLEGDFIQQRIIPLVLFTLTENIFKHGNLRNKDFPASLKISLTEKGMLTYASRNLKKSNAPFQKNSRIGLQNVKIRLDFDYPGNYSLDISESADFYELILNLNL